MLCVLDPRAHRQHRTVPIADLVHRQRSAAESFAARNRLISLHVAEVWRDVYCVILISAVSSD